MKRTDVGMGLYTVRDDGPVGPYHRRIVRTISALLDVMAYVELECGHTVVLLNELATLKARGWMVYCGECEDAAK